MAGVDQFCESLRSQGCYMHWCYSARGPICCALGCCDPDHIIKTFRDVDHHRVQLCEGAICTLFRKRHCYGDQRTFNTQKASIRFITRTVFNLERRNRRRNHRQRENRSHPQGYVAYFINLCLRSESTQLPSIFRAVPNQHGHRGLFQWS